MMAKCFLCSREVEHKPFNTRIICTQCCCPSCGTYGIDVKYFSDGYDDPASLKMRKKASCVAAEKRLKRQSIGTLPDNELMFYLHTQSNIGDVRGYPAYSLQELLDQYPKNTLELLDRTLLNLSRLEEQPGATINIMTDELRPICFVIVPDQFHNVLNYLANNGWCTQTTHNTTSHDSTTRITAQGWKRILELQKQPAGNSKQAFVAMWFDNSTHGTYDDGIKKAIEDCNYNAVRIDLKEHNNKICDEIIAEIRKSKFVVADFTGNRGGVYFESGFALGLGIPVIWTVHKDQLNDIHFDTNHYNHIPYSTPEELHEKLYNRIRATIV